MKSLSIRAYWFGEREATAIIAAAPMSAQCKDYLRRSIIKCLLDAGWQQETRSNSCKPAQCSPPPPETRCGMRLVSKSSVRSSIAPDWSCP